MNPLLRTSLGTIGLLLGVVAPLHAQASQTPPPAPAATDARPVDPVDVTYFHDALAPYGQWVELAPYGMVWSPRGMPAHWRPYTTGHWVFSDDVGWTWIEDEPWGWATFHYGRWTLDPALGWVWIPGTVWGPAWVAWRRGGGFVGWAPLPPCVGWDVGFGMTFCDADFEFVIGDPWWCFVPIGFLCHPRIHEVIVVPERAVTILHRTTIVRDNLGAVRGRPVNRAIAVEDVERASGQPIPRVRLTDVERPAQLRAARPDPGHVPMFRPTPGQLRSHGGPETAQRRPHPRPEHRFPERPLPGERWREPRRPPTPG